MIGTVEWFNDAKGFGFINSECGTRDIFVHYSALIDEGFKTLPENQIVEFDLIAGPKGPQAFNVKKIAVQS